MKRPPTDPFFRYKEYPNASYSQVKQALEKIGYHYQSDNKEIATFRKNLEDESERPVEVYMLDYIPQLNICLMTENNNLGEKFKSTLWSLIDNDNNS